MPDPMSVSETKSSPSTEFWAGGRATFPLMVGASPFGLIFGTLGAANGLSFAGTLGMSVGVFAGSAQFIALGLLGSHTQLWVIILTTFVVNLRHLLYSLTLAPYIKPLSQRWKIPLAFWLTDESFAVVIGRYRALDPSLYKHWYHLGSSLFMYLNWILWTGVGLTVGTLIPNVASLGLDFAMVATFIGMVIPYLTSRPMAMAVLISGGVALLSYSLPHKVGLILAALAGVLAGLGSEQWASKRDWESRSDE